MAVKEQPVEFDIKALMSKSNHPFDWIARDRRIHAPKNTTNASILTIRSDIPVTGATPSGCLKLHMKLEGDRAVSLALDLYADTWDSHQFSPGLGDHCIIRDIVVTIAAWNFRPGSGNRYVLALIIISQLLPSGGVEWLARSDKLDLDESRYIGRQVHDASLLLLHGDGDNDGNDNVYIYRLPAGTQWFPKVPIDMKQSLVSPLANSKRHGNFCLASVSLDQKTEGASQFAGGAFGDILLTRRSTDALYELHDRSSSWDAFHGSHLTWLCANDGPMTMFPTNICTIILAYCQDGIDDIIVPLDGHGSQVALKWTQMGIIPLPGHLNQIIFWFRFVNGSIMVMAIINTLVRDRKSNV